MNDAGQVTGAAVINTTGGYRSHAFLSGPSGGTLSDLGVIPGNGYDTEATAVNASGQVTGHSGTEGGLQSSGHVFLSGPNGGPLKDLGTLGGYYGYGTSVNTSGQVVGGSMLGGFNATHAFLSAANGGYP